MSKEDLWLTPDEKGETIARGSIIITDREKFDKFISEMKNMDNYIYQGSELIPGGVKSHLEYTLNGATQYKNNACSDTYYKYNYLNPIAEVYKLVTGKFASDKNLLDLFTSLAHKDNREKQLEELKKAREIIEVLRNSQMDIETIKTILVRMYPNFGTFATECLNFTDIKIEQSYKLSDIKSISEASNKAKVEVAKEVNEILANRDLAQSNGKILLLARDVHRITNN